MSVERFGIFIIGGLLLLRASVSGLAAAVNVNGSGELEVRTSRLAAIWRGSELVGLENRLSGDSYLAKHNRPADAFSAIRTIDGTGPMNAGKWELHGDAAILNVRGEKASFTLGISVDPTTEDIVIRQSGRAQTGGIHGLRWAVRGIDLRRARAVLPANAGGFIGPRTNAGVGEVAYPTDWEAQMAILEGRGSVLIWSTDATAQFKRLAYRRTRNLLDLAFETEPQAPFKDIRQLDAVEWRLNAFNGDWREAAGRYKEFLRRTYPIMPPAPKQSWARDIRAVFTVHGREFKDDILKALAEQVVPSKTLLYLASWRRDEYDVNYPDYAAVPSVKPFVDEAHRLGFRVMLHTDLPGVTPSNPVYEQVKNAQVRDRMSGALIGWYWESPDVPYRFAFINPASSEFRRILVERLRAAIVETGADALHLDVSGPMWNDANGLIEGMNYCQGSMALHRDLLAALPDTVLGGESVNEITYSFESFVQRWAFEHYAFDPHPICEFLFGESAASYGYLGMPNPDSSITGFGNYVRRYERQGVLPTLAFSRVSDLDPSKPYAGMVMRQMRLFQKRDLRPDFNSKWRASDKFVYRGSDGTAARITGGENSSKLDVGGETVYEWVRGVDRVRSKLRIADWPARDGDLSLGLLPERTYWLLPGKSPDATITRLTPGVAIREYRSTSLMLGINLAPTDTKPLYDFLEHISDATTGVMISGKERPLDYGASFHRSTESVGSVMRPSIFAHPPWKPTGIAGDEPWGEVFGEYALRLPNADGARLVLTFGTGIRDVAQETDGATFTVFVNGEQLFSRHVHKGLWWDQEVDLSRFAGQAVRIRFQVGPGPKHDSSWDHAQWAEPRIVRRSSVRKMASAALRPPRKPLQALTTDRAPETNLVNKSGEVIVEGLSLAASVFLIFDQPTRVSLPFDLIGERFEVGLFSGGMYSPGSVYGSGSLETATCEGIARRAINAHPPSDGQTVLTWLLKLPDDPVSLRTYAGLKDNAGAEGVGFAIAVNGKVLWSHSTRTPSWRRATVDLTRWAGQTVVLDLISDSRGASFCDWACWGEPVIAARAQAAAR